MENSMLSNFKCNLVSVNVEMDIWLYFWFFLCCFGIKEMVIISFILFQMGMTGNTSPFGQPFSQTGGQQMGATGVNPQLPNKPGMANSLSAFPADIKSTPVTSVPNMVSWTCFPWLTCLHSACWVPGWYGFCCRNGQLLCGHLNSRAAPGSSLPLCSMCRKFVCAFMQQFNSTQSQWFVIRTMLTFFHLIQYT